MIRRPTPEEQAKIDMAALFDKHGPAIRAALSEGDHEVGAGFELVPTAPDLITRLRSPDHTGPVDPKAVYRTRDVALFEEAAAEIGRLQSALQDAERERDKWHKAAMDAGCVTLTGGRVQLPDWKSRAQSLADRMGVLEGLVSRAAEIVAEQRESYGSYASDWNLETGKFTPEAINDRRAYDAVKAIDGFLEVARSALQPNQDDVK